MPRTVKLSSADARAWRENRAQWVSQKGIVLRAVTAEEENAIFPVMRRVEQFKQSGSCNVAAVYKVPDPASGLVSEKKVEMRVDVRVTRTGRDQNAYLYDTFVNGNRYVKGRDVLRARILEKHGECILQGPNGKQICVLRDPRVNRPTFSESQRSAPSPERCHCKGFKDNPDVGRHHIACEWNSKSPPHERALPIQRESLERGMMDLVTPIASMQFEQAGGAALPSFPSPQQSMSLANGRPITAPGANPWPQGGVAAMSGPVVMGGPAAGVSHTQAFAPPPPPPPLAGAPIYSAPQVPAGVTVAQTPAAGAVRNHAVMAPALVSPEACENDCRGIAGGTKGWAWPSGRKPEANQHHPMCRHEGSWRVHVTGQRRWMLYDMDRGVELRAATAEEKAKADIELQRNGVRSVQVGDRLFAVVEEGGAPAAAVDSPGKTLLAGSRVRPSPDQEALRPPPGAEAAGVVTTVTSRPARAQAHREPAELSLEELEAELARRRGLATAPTIPGMDLGPQTSDLEEDPDPASLRSEVRGPFESEQPSWGEDVTVEVSPALHSEPAPLPQLESTGLRDARGLVGLQQRDATIERGPVMIVDPEPFVDPIESEGAPIAAAS